MPFFVITSSYHFYIDIYTSPLGINMTPPKKKLGR